jgi:quinol monooxygenase YgiN
MTDPVRVVVFLQADPGKGPDQVTAFEQLAPLVRAEEGCLQYDLFAVVDAPDRFVVIEQWASREALDAHLAAPHMAAYAASVSAFRQQPAEVLVLGYDRVA